MLVSALVKPLWPKQVGLWIGPGIFNFGIHDAAGYGGGVGLLLRTGGPAREVLGWWYIPVVLAIGSLFIWGTTRLLRKLIKGVQIRPLKPFVAISSAMPVS